MAVRGGKVNTILCYGDSITWGYNPENGERYPHNVRWASLLQQQLGEEFNVIEEGLCGRYTVHDNPWREGRSGKALLQPILESHKPLDLVILMLGTNDVLHFSHINAFDAARGIDILIKKIQSSETSPESLGPIILLISPPLLGTVSDELLEYCHGHPSHSLQFAFYYRKVARERGLHFLDAAKFCLPSHHDGVHPDEDGHARLAEAIFEKVQEILTI